VLSLPRIELFPDVSGDEGSMSAFLFLTHEVENAEKIEKKISWWSCSTKVRKGDRILVYFPGDRKELVYEWVAVSDSYRRPGKVFPIRCHVQFVRSFDPPIPLDEIRRSVPIDESGILHHPQGTCNEISDRAAELLVRLRPAGIPVEAARDTGAAKVGRSGFPQANPEVERQAVETVTEVYDSRGWEVTSVEKEHVGFDLRCRKGNQEEHVEVKGMSGSVEKFTITRNELQCLRTDPLIVLATVVRALSPNAKPTFRSGPEALEFFQFDCLEYGATPKRS
jgi:hypothetical protein